MKPHTATQETQTFNIQPTADRLITLGWMEDGETDFSVLDLSDEALAQEIAERHRTERTAVSIKIEHAIDNAIAFAILNGNDPDKAASEAKSAILTRGPGLSLWLLSESAYRRWEKIQADRMELIWPNLEASDTSEYDTQLFNSLTDQFWAIFHTPPLTRISLAMPVMDLERARAIAVEALLTTIKTSNGAQTID